MSNELDLGLGGSGTYNLNAGGLFCGSNEYIGGVYYGGYYGYGYYGGPSGYGVFTQTGGTHSVASLLDLGGYGSSGTYDLSGSGLLVRQDEVIGDCGTAASRSRAEPMRCPPLYLGYSPGSSGSYSLCGSGLLTAGTEYVGYSGSGSFTQSGGTNRSPRTCSSASTRREHV